MGELADVPIEPETQTDVLDKTIALPGVIGGGVPGGKWLKWSCYFINVIVAGGYDALWVLIIDRGDTGVLKGVEYLWQDTKSMRVTPLNVSESEGVGLQLRNLDEVVGLSTIISEIGWSST